MSTDGTLGEISTYSYDFPPRGWMACNGQSLSIAQNNALFTIIGNKFGGDGTTKFNLPDLRGRVPVHFNQQIGLGKAGGEEKHILTIDEMPSHTHPVYGTLGTADQGNPTNSFWASNSGQMPYSNQPNTWMSDKAISSSGGGLGHENMSPYLALNFGICVSGNFKSREGTIGEIIMYAGNAGSDIRGWLPCEGQILPINGNSALFSILGTYYGGNGTSNFALPDLRGNAALACGQGNGLSNRTLGERGGVPAVTLLRAQMASHTHSAVATTSASTTNVPTGAVWATGGQTRGGVPFYSINGTDDSMHIEAIALTGNEQPHNNLPPYLGVSYLICTEGIYPSRP